MGRGPAPATLTPTLHLDTHVVAWLYAGEHGRFPEPLRAQLNVESLRISPMVRLELSYLHEIGRLTEPSATIIDTLASSVGLTDDDQAFADVVESAQQATFIRDPFDRIITAQALVAGAPLATKDEHIRAAYPRLAVWG